MKPIISRLIYLFLLYSAANYFIVSYAQQIYTPRWTPVYDYAYRQEFDTPTIADINAYYDTAYPLATRILPSSRLYNCHAFAWHISSGGSNNVWIGYDTETAEDVYWLDGSYDEVLENVATKVSYSANHSAITTSTPDVYISKWGPGPLMLHPKNYTPGYGSPSKHYRRSVDVPEDQSAIASALSAAVSGQTVHVSTSQILSENITVPSGVTLSTSSIILTFTNGATLCVNGTLNAVGTTFTGNAWSGISFQPNSSGSLTNCEITNAASCGIALYDASVSINSCNIHDNGAGISMGNSTCYIGNSQIRNNGGYGICAFSMSQPMLNNTIITGHTASGIYTYYSYAIISNNGIRNNNCGLFAYNNSFVNAQYSSNSFSNTSYQVSSQYYSSVLAEGNWWGSNPPNPSTFYSDGSSSIYRNNPLSSDPNPGLQKTSAQGNEALSQSSQGNGGGSLIIDLEIMAALQLVTSGKNEEAIYQFDQKFKKEKDLAKKYFCLVNICHIYLQNKKSGFVDYLNNSIRPTLSKNDVLYGATLELESFSWIKDGRYENAINNLLSINKDFKKNVEMYKYSLFNLGLVYNKYMNNKPMAKGFVDQLAKEYPDDFLTTTSKQVILGEEVEGINKQNKNVASDVSSPVDYMLSDNYPNPFNPTTNLSYQLPATSYISLKVFDMLGREVATLVDGKMEAGYHTTKFDGSRLSSGIYFVRFTAQPADGYTPFTKTMKMLMVK